MSTGTMRLGDTMSLGMRVLVGVVMRGGGWGRKQAPATVINGVCAGPLCASEEFITATLPCRQDYLDNALKPEGRAALWGHRVKAGPATSTVPPGAAGPAAG